MQSVINESIKAINNFLIQRCDKCNTEMFLDEGSIIYDGKWFHNQCWQSNTLQEKKESELIY